MSHEVNLEEPLSEFDRQYLIDRNRESDVIANDERFAESEPDEGGDSESPDGGEPSTESPEGEGAGDGGESESEEEEDDLHNLVNDELRDELTKLGVEFPSRAKKDELIELLAAARETPAS